MYVSSTCNELSSKKYTYSKNRSFLSGDTGSLMHYIIITVFPPLNSHVLKVKSAYFLVFVKGSVEGQTQFRDKDL